MTAATGIVCMVISLALLMCFAYKGVSVIVMAYVLEVFTYIAEGLITGIHVLFCKEKYKI